MSVTNSPRSFRSSMGSGSIGTLSLSNHSYHQARLCYNTDQASAQQQGWCRPHFPTFPTPPPASGTVIPHNAVIGNRTSTRCQNSGQSSFATKKFTPGSTFDSASQFDTVAPNTNQHMPSLMGDFTVPAQTLLSTYQAPSPPPPPPLPPHTPADQADIEYARCRYGDKRSFYQCHFDVRGSPCNQWIVGDRTRVLRHLRNHHRLQTGPATPALCLWDECTHSRPMKQENLSRHVVMHLGVKWKCPHCRRLFSRDDAVHRHIERMAPGVDATDAEVMPGPDARAITELQCKRARIA
jgi:hypothetical protein